MQRLTKLTTVIVPVLLLVAAPALSDVKTRERTQVHFEGMLGRMFSLFGGKAAKEGIESKTAVKGNRKATFNDATGKIIDLSEEKVYDLDMRKKTYTVTTFDELRRRMREQADKAKQQAQKEEPSQPQEAQKPQKEYEVDFDVKDTGQKKQIAGYDTHQTIVTITVREKGKTLEESGGLVMTNDVWLGPQIPQLKESADFEMRYWKQLEGPQMTTELSADQMAALVAMYPLISKASERMAKDSDKLKGTALDTLTTVESVKSPDQMAQAQQQSNQSTGGGLSGMMMKKMMKKEEPKQRATVMTTRHEILEVSTSVDASDVAVPADFKEKK
ncbi:MAG TPA: hypothetical protein VFZ98_07130 [Vicinamibacterales bacterium]